MKRLIVFGCMALAIGFYWFVSCRVIQSQTSAVTMTRRWTAVGDDGLIGRAARYEAKWSTDSLQLKNSWNTCVSCASWPGIASKTPDSSGTAESITFTSSFPTGVRLYFAIRAFDEVGNGGATSNLWDTLLVDGTAPARIADLH